MHLDFDLLSWNTVFLTEHQHTPEAYHRHPQTCEKNSFISCWVHPESLTWNLKMKVSKRNLLWLSGEPCWTSWVYVGKSPIGDVFQLAILAYQGVTSSHIQNDMSHDTNKVVSEGWEMNSFPGRVCFPGICWKKSHRKTSMVPENQWLEDIFPIEIIPF